MTEVFKINNQKHSKQVIEKLNQKLPNYQINFDLEDCDNILRVENLNGQIDNKLVIELNNKIGFYIEVLPSTLSPKNIFF